MIKTFFLQLLSCKDAIFACHVAFILIQSRTEQIPNDVGFIISPTIIRRCFFKNLIHFVSGDFVIILFSFNVLWRDCFDDLIPKANKSNFDEKRLCNSN